MQWSQLSNGITVLQPAAGADARVAGVEYDSRRVGPGSVFVAMRGGSTDGNRYLPRAVAAGAAAIVTDSPEAYAALERDHPQLGRALVAHGRKALAEASSAFFGHPERHLHSTGVTGTTGKTTTAFLLEALLAAAGRSGVLVGTIEYHVAGQVRPSAHTTPESRDLFELMADGLALGASELVMEVSSHALEQGRVESVGFDVAVFTNLTRDHLDYHLTMDAYFAAKRLLFDGTRYPAPRVAVVNLQDSWSTQLIDSAQSVGAQVVTYGLDPSADWRAEQLRLTPAGAEFLLVSPAGQGPVRSGLAGQVNVLNLLAALAAAHARGVGFATLVQAIGGLHPVPGRFQPVDAGQPFTVIVDYAHTDDALRNLTTLARGLVGSTGGRVITLFGCGGDRDRTKRPKMGQAAGQGSDFVVVTSDNPRSEVPEAIIDEILPALQACCKHWVARPDRGEAICFALDAARPGDVVLLAGKGHEKEQILADRTVPFDDAAVALSALRALGYGGEQCI